MAFNSENLYLNRAKLVMKILGIWVPSDKEGLIQKFHRFSMITLQYLFLLFQTIYIVQVWGDLDAVSQASYLLFTQACLCFKVTVLLVNMDMLKELLRQMDSDAFQPQSEIHEKILKLQATRIKRFLLAFMVSSQLTCGMWALKPLFDDAGSRKFPFDMWMPVSPEQTPQYHFGYAFQLLTICMSAYMYFAVDSVALSSVIFACAQFEIIKDKILSIEPVWYKNGKAVADIILNKNHSKLIECIMQHQAVISFTQLVEDAYHTYLLFQLTGSVGLICMSALRILVVDWKSMQFFSILSYLSVMISQLFVCCWCGHELSATSADLHTVLYECIWYEQSPRFKKDLLFAMMRMERPLMLKAGHYIPLLRQTFVSIQEVQLSGLSKEERNQLIKQNNLLLIDCISHHQTVKRFLNEVVDMFHVPIFIQMSGSILIVCVIMIRICVEPPNTVHFYSIIIYLFMMLAQLFLHCWSGNELTTTSEQLRERMYFCPWYDNDNKFRRTLCILMECLKRPMVVLAGHYIPLSRPTFVSILRCSYSYYAVLNQAQRIEE